MAEDVMLPEGFKVVYRPTLKQEDKTNAVNQKTAERNLNDVLRQLGGATVALDRGKNLGFGKKLGAAIYAAGSYPVDRVAQLVGVENTPSFSDRYNEVFQDAKAMGEEFSKEHPIANIATELYGAVKGLPTQMTKYALGKSAQLTSHSGKYAKLLADILALGGSGAAASVGMGAGETNDIIDYATSPKLALDAAFGGGATVAFPIVGRAIKRLFPSLNVIGKKSGLKNALDDIETLRAINRGSRASDEVAQGVLNRAQGVKGALNDEMADALGTARGRELDIQNAIDTQQKRLGKYVAKNADKELFSIKSPEEQAQQNFKRWFEGSKVVDENGKPLKLYHGTDADFDVFNPKKGQRIVKTYSDKSANYLTNNKEVAGTYGKSIKENYVNIKNPLVVDYNGKGFKNRGVEIDGKRFDSLNEISQYAKDKGYDGVIAKNIMDSANESLIRGSFSNEENKLYQDLLKKDYKTLYNEYNKLFPSSESMESFYKRMGKTKGKEYIAGVIRQKQFFERTNPLVIGNDYIIFNPNQIKSVKNSGAWSESPSLTDAGWKPTTPLSNYTQGLTDFQVGSLNKALAEGASKSTTPLGTLGATHRGQEVLNDMIEASFDKSMIGTKRPTTDTRQLMALKERFNQILEPSGVKPFDESYSKALGLRTNFEKGYNFKPSETKFESLGLEKARDKRAFLQGRLAKILDDVTDEKSIATLVKKDQNTLKKLMTPKKFETLMKTADEIEGNYRNLKNLETTANSALRRSSDASRPLSEKMESFTSMVGSALDKLLGGIYRRSDAATARRILSGQPIPQNSILLNNLRNSTPAVSGIMVEELLKN